MSVKGNYGGFMAGGSATLGRMYTACTVSLPANAVYGDGANSTVLSLDNANLVAHGNAGKITGNAKAPHVFRSHAGYIHSSRKTGSRHAVCAVVIFP